MLTWWSHDHPPSCSQSRPHGYLLVSKIHPPKSECLSIIGDFLSHRGTPSPHPLTDGTISRSQKPSSDLGGTPIDGSDLQKFLCIPMFQMLFRILGPQTAFVMAYTEPVPVLRTPAALEIFTYHWLPLVSYYWLPLGCNYYGSCIIYIYTHEYIWGFSQGESHEYIMSLGGFFSHDIPPVMTFWHSPWCLFH